MKSFKFIKVCLLVLGICSFAFSSVKAEPPVSKSTSGEWASAIENTVFYSGLMENTKETLKKIHGCPPLIKIPGLKTVLTLNSRFENYIGNIIRTLNSLPNENEKINAAFAIGFYFQNKNNIYINPKLFATLCSCSKSLLHSELKKLGYLYTEPVSQNDKFSEAIKNHNQTRLWIVKKCKLDKPLSSEPLPDLGSFLDFNEIIYVNSPENSDWESDCDYD